jgi:hypothetical protein
MTSLQLARCLIDRSYWLTLSCQVAKTNTECQPLNLRFAQAAFDKIIPKGYYRNSSVLLYSTNQTVMLVGNSTLDQQNNYHLITDPYVAVYSTMHACFTRRWGIANN